MKSNDKPSIQKHDTCSEKCQKLAWQSGNLQTPPV